MAFTISDYNTSGNVSLGNPITLDANITSSQASISELTLDGTLVTVGGDKINYLSGVTSDIQTQLNAKHSSTLLGAVSTITDTDLTTERVLISNTTGKVAVSNITINELNYLDGVNDNIQLQFDNIGLGAVSSIMNTNLLPNKILSTDANGKITTFDTVSYNAFNNVQHLENITTDLYDTLNDKYDATNAQGGVGEYITKDLSGNVILATNQYGKLISSEITLLDNGKLGIGTNNPSKAVDIHGDLNLVGGNLFINGSLLGNTDALSPWGLSGSNITYTAGRVGIGNNDFANTTGSLIVDTLEATDSIKIGGNILDSSQFTALMDAATNNGNFTNNNYGTWTNDKVGIGTNAPDVMLDVKGNNHYSNPNAGQLSHALLQNSQLMMLLVL